MALAKSSLNNLMGKTPDTTYKVVDTIMVNHYHLFQMLQIKLQQQNPDILLANSDLRLYI